MKLSSMFSVFCIMFAVGCVPAQGAGTYGATYSTPAITSGVYVNGQELTVEQKAELDEFLGETLPAGRYFVDADGNMGFEGQAPRVNLVAFARSREQRGGTPMNMYSRDSAGRGSSIVSDGKCIILSTPDGSMSSGC
jgi:hypothetical protein